MGVGGGKTLIDALAYNLSSSQNRRGFDQLLSLIPPTLHEIVVPPFFIRLSPPLLKALPKPLHLGPKFLLYQSFARMGVGRVKLRLIGAYIKLLKPGKCQQQ